MNKFFITLGLVLGLISTANATSYKDVVISDRAASIIKSLKLSKNFNVKKINGKKYYALKYDDMSSEFVYLENSYIDDFSEDDLTNNLRVGRYVQVNSSLLSNDKGDCKHFVKSLSNAPESYSVKENYGNRLSPNLKIKYGTIIVSHPKKNVSGHTAIVLYVGKKYIWVMDQNSYIKQKGFSNSTEGPTRGIVGIHRIKFKNYTNFWQNGYYDDTNAYNYHALQVKK